MQPIDATPLAATRAPRRTVSQRTRRALAAAALPLAALALTGAPLASAAGVDPLPAVAKALSSVTRYEVTITSITTTTGRRPRPTGTPRAGTGNRARRGAGLGFGPGPQTRTIIAVRKGNAFEDYIVVKGRDMSGKATTTEIIAYGAKVCTRSSGARSYTCRTMQGQQGSFNLDPTTAFAAGAGSTTFARAGAKTIEGQLCDAYSYQNVSQGSTAKGVVYIARKTHLPCEQDATVTRQFNFQGASGSFTQKSTIIWSRFNDARLSVPSIPAS